MTPDLGALQSGILSNFAHKGILVIFPDATLVPQARTNKGFLSTYYVPRAKTEFMSTAVANLKINVLLSF